MKNIEIKRLDTRCALCRLSEANEVGSHLAPNLLTAPAFSFDGKPKRDREIVDSFFINDCERNATYYGREVSPVKITTDLGHEMTEEEVDKNLNVLCFDHIFCKDCEKRFSIIESAYADFYLKDKQIHPRVAYLFWLSVFWRMSIGNMGLCMDFADELAIREILNRNLKPPRDIISSSDSLGDFGYALFRLDTPLRKGDSGIMGSCQLQAPYLILVADYAVVLFKNYSKLHKCSNVFGWKIDKEDINAYDKEVVELEMSIKDLYAFKRFIIDQHFNSFNPEQEKVFRTIREYERSKGKPIEKNSLYSTMQLLKIYDQERFQVRNAYRFKIAYIKTLKAKSEGVSYDFLQDRDVMLTQSDVDNYIKDLKKLQREGMPLEPFAFAREFLNDDTIPSFNEVFEQFRQESHLDVPELKDLTFS